jgi:hypothetical protein
MRVGWLEATPKAENRAYKFSSRFSLTIGIIIHWSSSKQPNTWGKILFCTNLFAPSMDWKSLAHLGLYEED